MASYTLGSSSMEDEKMSNSLRSLETQQHHYSQFNISSRLGHSKVRVLRDGRFTVHTSETAQRIASHMQKKLRRRAPFGEMHRQAKKKDHKDYEATLGEYKGAPRINIAIHIVGSRGDVQPFIAIGQTLSKPPYSHRVRICTHPVFKDFVEDNGLEFFSIGGDPANLMAYMVKNPGLMPGIESLRAGDVGKRRSEMAEILDGAWRSCIEPGNGMKEDPTHPDAKKTKAEETDRLFIADAIIANPPSYAHLHCAEKLGIPLHMIFTMPWSPTQAFPHPLANVEPSNVDASIANYLSYSIMELLAWQGLGDIINRFRTKTLNLDPISPLWGHLLLARMHVPFTYCWSQSLIAKPKDWGPHINISGFSFLPLASSYKPPEDLVKFLEAGTPPVYIGFGSIVVAKPDELTAIIFGAVKRAGVRAIVSKGWGGLGNDSTPEGVFMLGNCPHDWLFQHVSCVVHHGGAGTTAIGLAMGKPTVVVPFFGDQPFWGAMIFRAGAGPEPVPFRKMTAETLANSIAKALGPEIKTAAEAIGETIAKENPGASEVVRYFNEATDLPGMRCYLSPDRVAVWRVKKTNLQLSGVAVAALLGEGYLKLDQVKLIRHRDWYVDEGAEGPVSGAVAAVSETVTSIVLSIADYSKAMSRSLRRKTKPKNDTVEEGITNATEEMPDGYSSPTADHLYEITSRIEIRPLEMYPQGRLEYLAYRMVSNTTKKPKFSWQRSRINKAKTFSSTSRNSPAGVVSNKEHSKAHDTVHNTTEFAGSMIRAKLRAPVTFFYNLANGCHNLPSYAFQDDTVRRRDNITGFGSGLKVAAKEYGYGMFDGITGLVTQPYRGARKEGVVGFGKGVGKGVGGLVFKVGAAQFGLLGYTLKGVERQVHKRSSRELKARIVSVRLRLGLQEFERATEEEKSDILARWKKISESQN